MAKKNKILKSIKCNVSKKTYSFDKAIYLIKKCAFAKFNESIDVSIKLNIDNKKSNNIVRGSISLPAGLGKYIRVAVFADGEGAKKALSAGADHVGMNDLLKKIKNGNIKYDTVISSNSSMKLVSSLGPILGPRGLMPNIKLGTITNDLESAVKNAKFGQLKFKADKYGIINTSIGRKSFSKKDLKLNLFELINFIKKNKANNFNGEYIKKISISSTMGIGLNIDLSTVIP